MKRTLTIFAAVLLTATIFAQAPEKMSYQAVVRDANNDLVTDTQVGMQISILQGAVDGAPVYVETQTPTTNANGLVSVEIGGGTVESGDFTAIDWSAGPYFIKTETDPAGGTDYTITGTSQLLSVPYALYAKRAESIRGGITETDPVYTAWNKSYNDLTDKPNITDTVNAILDTTTQFVRTEVDGSVTNEIQNLSSVLAEGNDAGSTNITNIADPINAQDAATKAYVDALKAQVEELQLLTGLRVKDYDGNFYKTVTIGTQVWMAENLKVTHYPNGDTIPLVTDNNAWGDLADDNTSDAYCYYNNNANNEADTYGALYTYAAAIGDNWQRDNTANQGVCPDGWHLPTVAEWDALMNYLGTNSGSKLAGNAELWQDGALVQSADFGTSGFSALPGGDRSASGKFWDLGYWGYWWCADEYREEQAYFRYQWYDHTEGGTEYWEKSYGLPVRCVKD